MQFKVEFKYPCSKCGAKMYARPGGYPERGPNLGAPFAECSNCGHGAIVMGLSTAEARVKGISFGSAPSKPKILGA